MASWAQSIIMSKRILFHNIAIIWLKWRSDLVAKRSQLLMTR